MIQKYFVVAAVLVMAAGSIILAVLPDDGGVAANESQDVRAASKE
jgi:hypothetical protein